MKTFFLAGMLAASAALAGQVNLLSGFKFVYKNRKDYHFKKMQLYDFKAFITDREQENDFDRLRIHNSIYYVSTDAEAEKHIEFLNGMCEQTIRLVRAPKNSTFVLQYIDITLNDSTHIKDFKVCERDNKLYVDFCDKHRNTYLRGEIHYAWVSKDAVSEKQTYIGEPTRDRIQTLNLLESPIALAGFHFHYKKGDHHIGMLGINGNFTQIGKPDIIFGDNARSEYEYFIDYVNVL